MQWEKHDGKFLFSKSKLFVLPSILPRIFKDLLVIGHIHSCQIIRTANIDLSVGKTDKFVFDNNGNVYLERGDGVAWATNTTGENATSLELLDSGNLVLHGADRIMIWQSFSYPSDTLLSGQEIPDSTNLWSLSGEMQETYKNFTGKEYSAAVLVSNSQNKKLICQFNFSQNSDMNVTWAARLGDGAVMFYNLSQKGKAIAEAKKIPQNPCNIPVTCSPIMIYYVGRKLDYSVLNTGNCYLFDRVGSLKHAEQHSRATATVLVIAGLLLWDSITTVKRRDFRNLLKRSWRMTIYWSVSGDACEMPDGTQLAVKKLESIGQGKKEFRVEVRIIGSIHHVHLVTLKGFCSEDFGLAKLISREESLVYTTLRGTRGYLAPEWITNNPISEKSDVYSYGMVLFEIIGGRKSYDPEEIPEKVIYLLLP
ncbi:hypothetical protein F3Y22_tig00110430pilonHSYRG00256 [Hibiscus syriacus]|uniref:Bulb-type lectin domain-containing protein n=1 Tax=Hibiscus syriacus TaxID=106335 RepID=A0A6A3ALV0_HIBSY|nr:hypothetical protein F3Y22_tig00110430pilonHSYRG00256 [Hibiscus syriacus]